MQQDYKHITEPEGTYRIRWMACFALAEAVMLLIVLLWPVPAQKDTFQDIVYSENEIAMEEVQITEQRSTPPPPPRPQIPVPVPNDQIIEEEILELEEIDIPEFDDPLAMEGFGREGSSDRVTANPQTPPRIVRIVEPTFPEQAKKENIKAQVVVTFLVNEEGVVEEATIAEVKIYDSKKDEYVITNSIGYGLTEATIEAALQWKFRPARDNDKPVRSYTKHTFNYGN